MLAGLVGACSESNGWLDWPTFLGLLVALIAVVVSLVTLLQAQKARNEQRHDLRLARLDALAALISQLEPMISGGEQARREAIGRRVGILVAGVGKDLPETLKVAAQTERDGVPVDWRFEVKRALDEILRAIDDEIR